MACSVLGGKNNHFVWFDGNLGVAQKIGLRAHQRQVKFKVSMLVHIGRIGLIHALKRLFNIANAQDFYRQWRAVTAQYGCIQPLVALEKVALFLDHPNSFPVRSRG